MTTPNTYRPTQQAMANAIRQAIQQRHHLLLEAGTGEGKSFLFLQEALRYVTQNPTHRVMIATPTKSLQDQFAAEADRAGARDRVALLKGLAAYVCLRDWTEQCPPQDQAEQLIQITRAGGALDGPDVPANLTQYRTDHDGCDGLDCPHFAPSDPSIPTCYYQAAIREADHAPIVIISHAALATHLLLVQKNTVGYLPTTDLLMIDEAHVWPTNMAMALSKQVTPARLQEQAQSLLDGKNIQPNLPRKAKRALKQFIEHCDDINHRALQLLGPKRTLLLHSPYRMPTTTTDHIRQLAQNLLEEIANGLDTLFSIVKPIAKEQASSSEGRSLRRLLRRWTGDARIMREFAAPLGGHSDDPRHDAMAMNLRTTSHLQLQRSASNLPHITFLRQPTRVRRFLYQFLCGPTPIIFTSGTLRTRLSPTLEPNQQCADILHELGFYAHSHQEPEPPFTISCYPSTLAPSVTLHLADQTYPPVAAYTPEDVGEERAAKIDTDYSTPPDQWLDTTVELLGHVATQPGAMYVLCTSYIAMTALENRLRQVNDFPRQILTEQKDYTTEPRRALQAHPDSTLVLSVNGWEGVDLPAIRHLFIHRLPFHVVNLDLYPEHRQFHQLLTTLIPKTSIRLRQGIGRLVRTPKDSGHLYILDRRIKQWAKHLLGMTINTNLQTQAYELQSTTHALWSTTKIQRLKGSHVASQPVPVTDQPALPNTEPAANPPIPTHEDQVKPPSAGPPSPPTPQRQIRNWITSLTGRMRA